VLVGCGVPVQFNPLLLMALMLFVAYHALSIKVKVEKVRYTLVGPPPVAYLDNNSSNPSHLEI
jgi:hypothetical protein